MNGRVVKEHSDHLMVRCTSNETSEESDSDEGQSLRKKPSNDEHLHQQLSNVDSATRNVEGIEDSQQPVEQNELQVKEN